MGSQKKDLIIIGSGGHSRVIIDAAESIGFNIIGIIDINFQGIKENILNYPVLGDLTVLNKFDSNTTALFIAIGDGIQRLEQYSSAKKNGYFIPTIIHPSTIMSKHFNIGEGVFINAGVIINADVQIGDNSIINTGTILDHEVKLGVNSHIGPGCKISGRVHIGNNTFIGTGTSIIDKIHVGDNVIIGAGSVIIRNVENNTKVAGVPGRRIK